MLSSGGPQLIVIGDDVTTKFVTGPRTTAANDNKF